MKYYKTKSKTRKIKNTISFIIAALVFVGGMATQTEFGRNMISNLNLAGTSVEVKSEADIPDYDGTDVIILNNGKTSFTEKELAEARGSKPYEEYADLDVFGRCHTAIGVLDHSMMPTEEREGIGQYKPSGWQTVTYPDLITTRYLYNRGHLLAFCLGGSSTNNRNNLITMTRQCNENMIPYEVSTAQYLERDDSRKVIYRTTPVYDGNNLIAKGVQMEIKSLGNDDIETNVFIYNVQDGIKINYSDGTSERA